MIGIYKITNPKGKIYIGQSINIRDRFYKYNNLNCKEQIKLYRSLNKYGVNNHIFEIIEECLEEELNNRERYYQDLYNVIEKGLNLKLTQTNDKSGKLSNETKLKISLSNKGKSKNIGRVLSEDTKLKISKAHIGKVLSNSTKNKISKANKNRKMPESHYIKRSIATKGINNPMYGKTGSLAPSSKKVICTKTNIIYDSIKEAAISININVKTLSYKLNKPLKNNTSLEFFTLQINSV